MMLLFIQRPGAAQGLTAGWALQRLWVALYGAKYIERLCGFATLQKRPPEGAVGRCAAAHECALIPREGVALFPRKGAME